MREITRFRSASSRCCHLSSTLFKENVLGLLSASMRVFGIPDTSVSTAFLTANAALQHLWLEISLDLRWYAKYHPQRSFGSQLVLGRNGMAQAARKQPETGRSAETSQQGAVRQVLEKVKAEARTSLTAPEGKLVCDAYGIPVPKEGVAISARNAAKLAQGMGFPVVLKIVSPDILHKTEAGGVLVGLKSADEVSKG